MNQGNLLLVHGGAPTAVMNASVYGVLQQARKHPEIGCVYGACCGTGGILEERFLPLSHLSDEQLARLLITPGSAIGTSRTPLYEAEYQQIARILMRHNIRWVLFNGGNGTMDACGHVHSVCRDLGIQVVGIPKTIDNDIAVTDHAPGYGSAARYLAATVSEVCHDVHALPIHVCIVEAMGRNAGWLAASAALAGEVGFGPDLIYLPERCFDEKQFLNDVQRLHREKGGVVVVVSEGLHDAQHQPIVPAIFRTDRAVYYGDVGSHLANLVIQRLGIKARSEKPGICGRASFAHQSSVDREEAVRCGERAVSLALQGVSGVMVTLDRQADGSSTLGTAAIEQVMLTERTMPDEYINHAGNGVTPAFLDWCRPLIGDPLPTFLQL